jgi:hypothetical protein
LARRSRVELTVRCPDEAAIPAIMSEFKNLPAGSGIVRIVVPVSDGRSAQLHLPGRFAVDAELGARLERFVGEGGVSLAAAEQLRLVG